jgi:hypothetical protein
MQSLGLGDRLREEEVNAGMEGDRRRISRRGHSTPAALQNGIPRCARPAATLHYELDPRLEASTRQKLKQRFVQDRPGYHVPASVEISSGDGTRLRT